MNPALSPDKMIALGKALDIIVDKYGPFADGEKVTIAEKLLRLSQDGTWDIDQLVELAIPANKRN